MSVRRLLAVLGGASVAVGVGAKSAPRRRGHRADQYGVGAALDVFKAFAGRKGFA